MRLAMTLCYLSDKWKILLLKAATAQCVPDQVYAEVQRILPDVQYIEAGHILTLRTSGARKQPRLPGQSGSSDPAIPLACIESHGSHAPADANL